jgi:hypothetical protein
MEASDDLSAFFWLPPSGDCKISNASSRSEGRGWVGIIWRAVGMELSAFRRIPSASMHDIDLLLEELFFIFGCARRIYSERIRLGSGRGGIAKRAHIHCVHLICISLNSSVYKNTFPFTFNVAFCYRMRKTGHPGVPKGKCGNIGYTGTKIVLIRGAAVPMGTRSYFDGYFSQSCSPSERLCHEMRTGGGVFNKPSYYVLESC